MFMIERDNTVGFSIAPERMTGGILFLFCLSVANLTFAITFES